MGGCRTGKGFPLDSSENSSAEFIRPERPFAGEFGYDIHCSPAYPAARQPGHTVNSCRQKLSREPNSTTRGLLAEVIAPKLPEVRLFAGPPKFAWLKAL